MTNLEHRLSLARGLQGKFVRFAHESATSRGRLVLSVDDEGLVEIDGFVGKFGPHLFEVVSRSHSAAEGNC